VLREDLIGFGLGGNKVRKLDYLFGEAVRARAGSLVTHGASSFSRNAAAAAKVLGIELHVVIKGSERKHSPLSRSWFDACGARLHYTEATCDAEVDQLTNALEHDATAQGVTFRRLHPGGSDPIGALSYVDVYRRIQQYSELTGVQFDAIVIPTGSTGTQVGLIVGQSLVSTPTRIIGVAISQPHDVQTVRTVQLCREFAAFHGVDVDESLVEIDDGFLGPGYAIPSSGGDLAANAFLQREGIVLDAVYTAKAAAALLAWCEDGTFAHGSNVLFVHTGGNGGLYY
jgi:1-aminocyclopropane-1-carboxylate deaminase/D-cysteine desulfhydrase-like pyridoxal-dependent ACC family enzyme